jgi:hypothetical protein
MSIDCPAAPPPSRPAPNPRALRCRWMVRGLLAVGRVCLLGSIAFGQAARPSLRGGRRYDPAAFAAWRFTAITSVAAPGPAVVRVAQVRASIVGGPSFEPLGQLIPIKVLDGTRSEVIIPSATSCSAGACQLTADWREAHQRRFELASGDFGLQEAVDYATDHGGGLVTVGPGFAGAAGPSPITALARGSALTMIEDTRGGNDVWYGWNGSDYGVIFNLAKPFWIDPRSFGASGSNQVASAGCTQGSAMVDLSENRDFEAGQGLALPGCGASAFDGSPPTAPTPEVASFCGGGGAMTCAPGTTAYNYKLVVVDAHEGYTAAGPAGSTSTGAANLGVGCCNMVGGANLLSWSAPAGITTNDYGFLVYGEKQGDTAYRLIGLVTIPGYARPWRPSSPYAMGRFARPAASPNGSYYVAITGGTSGGSEPTWCTSSATCTESDGSVTWQRQPFTWMDECTDSTGATACTAPITWAPAWVPTSPPTAAAADTLVSSIVAGGGTTTLTLATAAANTQAEVQAMHDDTAAVAAALQAQGEACLNVSGSGFARDLACPQVRFAPGTYAISSPVPFGSNLQLEGSGAAVLVGENPFASMFQGDAHRVEIEGLHTVGSLTPYDVTEADDADVFDLAQVDAQYTTDYVVMLHACAFCGGAANISGRFVANRRFVYSSIDWLRIRPQTWLEPSYSNSQPWEAQIFGAGEWVSIDGMVGIPQPKPYDRWVDNWTGNITIDNGTRLGAENGGMSAIYTFAGHGAGPSWLGATLVIRDSDIGVGSTGQPEEPAAGIIDPLNGTFPQQVVLEGDANLQTTPLFDPCSGLETADSSAPCALPAGFQPTNLDTAFNDTLGQAQNIAIMAYTSSDSGLRCLAIQPPLLPYVVGPAECRQAAAAPTSGIWLTGGSGGMPNQTMWNANLRAGQPLGWALQANPPATTVRAAPAWQPNHTYTLAASPEGEGSDYVEDTSGHVFYVGGVMSGMTCTSGPAQPDWNTSAPGAATSDGTCIWDDDNTPAASWAAFGAVFAGLNDTSARFVGTILTTAATSNTLPVPGMTSAGHCLAQATNAAASGLGGVACTAGSGLIRLAHAAVAGASFDVFASWH